MDVWRELNPLKRYYTYFSNPHLLYSRIDYFLIFGKDLHRVGDCGIGIMDLSDHSPLYLKLNLEQSQRNTVWRLNITDFLEQDDNGEVTPPILWDACKVVQRGKIIGYSSHLKRATLKELNQLQTELKQLEQKHKDTNDKKIKEALRKKKNEIDEIYTRDVQKSSYLQNRSIMKEVGKTVNCWLIG